MVDVGVYVVSMVKTNKNDYLRIPLRILQSIVQEVITSCLREISVVPSSRPSIAFGYKYNTRRVISFVDIEEAGITKDVITHLSKYPDPFANFFI